MKKSNRANAFMHSKDKEIKPRSDLQILHSKVMWAIHFKLQNFSEHSLGKMSLSWRTRNLIDTYRLTVRDLKISIQSDYRQNKQIILAKRKKLLDSKTDP